MRNLQLRRADLTGRAPTHEYRTNRRALPNQLPHLMYTAGCQLTPDLFACALGRGRDPIGHHYLVALEHFEHLARDPDSDTALLHCLTVPVARGAAQQGMS